jgi:Ras-related protein Rab-6A
MTEEDAQHFKLIFLGDQYVGKSSILNRFYQDKFEADYQATIGLDFHSKNVTINGNNIRLLLYDTAGQEKFKSLIPMYIRDANIILVVYDITNRDTFTHTEHWVNETKDLKRDDAIFVLVGNKIDLEENRVVTKKEAEDFATEKGFLFHEVSAKTGEQVQELFTTKIFPEIARKYNIGEEEENGQSNEQNNENDVKGVKLNSNNKPAKKKGGCCGGGKGKKAKNAEQGNQEGENNGGTKESQGNE